MSVTTRLRAVIFDWGGVLVRTFDPQPRRALEAQYNLPPGSVGQLVFGSPAWARCQVGEWSEQKLWDAVGQRQGLSPEQTADFRRRFFAGDRLDDELVAFIRSLRPGLKTALLSNFSTHLRHLLDQYHLADAFDAVVISAEEGIVKPDVRIYHAACQRLGVQPDEAVFVDDFAENVTGAQRAGLQAIHFTSTTQTLQALRHLGCTSQAALQSPE